MKNKQKEWHPATKPLKRKMSGVGKNTVIQVLSAIVAIGGYFKFECVLSL